MSHRFFLFLKGLILVSCRYGSCALHLSPTLMTTIETPDAGIARVGSLVASYHFY